MDHSCVLTADSLQSVSLLELLWIKNSAGKLDLNVTPLIQTKVHNMITQHGPKCDVCSDYILTDKSINPFKAAGIERELHCHDKCKELVLQAAKDKSYLGLPAGPLRESYESAMSHKVPK